MTNIWPLWIGGCDSLPRCFSPLKENDQAGTLDGEAEGVRADVSEEEDLGPAGRRDDQRTFVDERDEELGSSRRIVRDDLRRGRGHAAVEEDLAGIFPLEGEAGPGAEADPDVCPAASVQADIDREVTAQNSLNTRPS